MSARQRRFRPSRPARRATGALARRPRLAVYRRRRRRRRCCPGCCSARWPCAAPPAGLPAERRATRLLEGLPELPLPDCVERFVCALPDAGAARRSRASRCSLRWSLMWFLMAVAMMLPSAAPMIRTYCEIADTARSKGEPVVHPLVLVAGYLVGLACGGARRLPALTLSLQAVAGGGAARSACRRRRRCRARRCRALPVQRPEGSLPREMPQPVRDPVLALERAAGRHLPARRRAGRLVPRLLLGADAGDVRRRRDEHLLDGADRRCLPWSKNRRAARSPPGLPVRYCLYGRRRC